MRYSFFRVIEVNILLFNIIIFFTVISDIIAYTIPTPKFELLSPKGIKISIPGKTNNFRLVCKYVYCLCVGTS